MVYMHMYMYIHFKLWSIKINATPNVNRFLMTVIMINNSKKWSKLAKKFCQRGFQLDRVRESGNETGNYLLHQNTSVSLNYSNFMPQSKHIFCAFFSFAMYTHANTNILLNVNQWICVCVFVWVRIRTSKIKWMNREREFDWNDKKGVKNKIKRKQEVWRNETKRTIIK